jgi:FkbM family methyltransferase
MVVSKPSKFFALRKSQHLFRSLCNRLVLWNFHRFLKSCNSIVHVGANSGQERELYDSYGLSVVWIEAIPAVYQELARNIEPYPKQMAIQALLSDRADHTVEFNIANNSGASSSIFDLALHKDLWPEISYVDQITLQTETLDRVLAGRVIGLPIDAIILDTQGSELLVLKGAKAVLRQTMWLKIEAADFEAYKGGTTVESIREFLQEYSFRLVGKTIIARHPSGGRYYDLLFKKSGGRERWIGIGE